MLRPVSAFRELAREAEGGGKWLLLQRPLLHALLLGGFLSLATTGRVVLPLALSTTVCWAFVPALQVAVVTAVTKLLGARPFPVPRLVDLYFVGNLPWSLWLLALSGTAILLPSETPGLPLPPPGSLFPASLLAAALLSQMLTFGFFRGALGLTIPRSLAALVLHDVFLWGSIALFFLLSDQLWPRLFGKIGI
ncbi:MAG TPA: hypothetical protein VKF62_08340 [Planctomycetota bacterium]|nr:hypothetical protein [Planctomycetota bacterium]